MSAKKGQAKKANQKRKVRYTVTLNDGTVARVKRRAKPRRRESASEVASRIQHIRNVVPDPGSFRYFDNLHLGTGPNGGAPRTFPPEMISVLFALRFAFGGKTRELVREISSTPDYLKLVANGVLKNMRDKDQRSEFSRLLRAGRFPYETTLLRAWDSPPSDELHAFLLRQGADLAVEFDHFNTDRQRNTADPQWHDVVYADGSKYKPYSDNQHPIGVDDLTGEIYDLPVDDSAREHTEGGASEPTFGTNVVTISSRRKGYNQSFTHAVTTVEAPDPAAEATAAVALTLQVEESVKAAARLAGDGVERHVSALVYDGAAVSDHHRDLLAQDIHLVNSPPAKSTRINEETGARERVTEHTYTLPGARHHRHARCSGHTIQFERAQPFLKEKNSDGQWVQTPLRQRLKPVRRNGRIYHYLAITVPCRTRNCSEEILLPLHQGDGESGADYRRRLQYVRAYPPTSPQGTYLAGVRQSKEADHSQNDRTFDFKRIPAKSHDRKLRLMIALALGRNTSAAAQARNRSSGAGPP